MDPHLLLFRRQYLQLFEPDFLAWPPPLLLKDTSVQNWLYRNLFDDEVNAMLPPPRYQVRVLKALLPRIERAINDFEQDAISDSLMSHVSSLMASELPSELAAAQQKSYVTFTCPSNSDAEDVNAGRERTVSLLERRHLISGSLTTGFRTWEASLHLGTYLLAHPELIRGKNVLELGAGTGFLSILCAKHLGAEHVTTTDGDEAVVEALKENLFLNNLDDSEKVVTSVLRWGWGLKGTWVEEKCEAWPYDVVIGADITYDKPAIHALVGTLRMIFNLVPMVQVIVAGAVRNAETFETFKQTCRERRLPHVTLSKKP